MRNILFGPTSLVFLSSFIGVSTVSAQTTPPCFTLASLQGSYAVVTNYGSNVATALGLRNFDGNGNLTGTFLINSPTSGSSTGARTITTGSNVGTYKVNCDGTGTITRTITGSNGVVANQTDDFIITGSFVKNFGTILATSLTDVQETPAAIVSGGLFVNRTYTRLPDRAASQ